MTGYDTMCYGLDVKVGFGQRLDSMTLRVFSNHNDSINL